MSKTKSYTNAPADIAEEIENSVAIDDFLPIISFVFIPMQQTWKPG